MKKRNILMIWFVLLLVFGVSAPIQAAETWPDVEKTITVIVPYSAGGGADLIFRPLVEEMKKHTEANVIVSNISGAGSSKGHQRDVKSSSRWIYGACKRHTYRFRNLTGTDRGLQTA